MRKVRVACALAGVVLLAVNVFVCFDPWLDNTLQHLGSASSVEETAAGFTLFVWMYGGFFGLAVPLANHFERGSVNPKQVWSRLTTAFTIGWFAAFLGAELAFLSRHPGNPVIGMLIFAWSIAGAICLLQEMPLPKQHDAQRV